MSKKEPYQNVSATVRQENSPLACAVETFNILGIHHYGPPLATSEKNRNILADWFDAFPQRRTLLKNYIPAEKLLFGVDGCGAQVEGTAAKLADVEKMWKRKGLETLTVGGECFIGYSLGDKATYLLHYRSGRASLAVFKPSLTGSKNREEYDDGELHTLLSVAAKSPTVLRDRVSQTGGNASGGIDPVPVTRRRRTRNRARPSGGA